MQMSGKQKFKINIEIIAKLDNFECFGRSEICFARNFNVPFAIGIQASLDDGSHTFCIKMEHGNF